MEKDVKQIVIKEAYSFLKERKQAIMYSPDCSGILF
ncbi:MAG: hypothetical protein ACJA1D_000277 [Polaribacter sp.]|jgi:hypothetical protein